jgi:hypothetical protein
MRTTFFLSSVLSFFSTFFYARLALHILSFDILSQIKTRPTIWSILCHPPGSTSIMFPSPRSLLRFNIYDSRTQRWPTRNALRKPSPRSGLRCNPPLHLSRDEVSPGKGLFLPCMLERTVDARTWRRLSRRKTTEEDVHPDQHRP